MNLLGRSLLGKSLGAGTNATLVPKNPATGEALSPACISATSEEVNHAVALAVKAFSSYAKTTPNQRATFLRTIADGLAATGEDFQQRVMAESGLPQPRIAGELGRTVGQLRMFAELLEEGSWVEATLETPLPDRKPLPKADLRSMLLPLGPVAVFCASNFPLAFSVAGGDTAAALASGCPVIVKAHHSHLGTAEWVGRIILHAAEICQMPEGVFSLLFDGNVEVGQQLVQHPGVRAVGFTGSRQGGKALMQLAQSREVPIPVFAEMSSINPFVVLPGAAQERGQGIAEGLHASITTGCGQFCTKPGVIFLPDNEAGQKLAQTLSEKMQNTPAQTMLNQGIATNYERLSQKKSATNGLQSLAQGSENAQLVCSAAAKLWRVSAGEFVKNQECQEEVFGPSALLVFYSGQNSLEELKNCLSILEGQLTASLHAGSGEDVRDIQELLLPLAGRLVFNGYPTGVEVCHAMIHGGPFPATSDGRSTSVGSKAIQRFTRPVCFQNAPDGILPPALQTGNPLGIWRLVDGKWLK